MVKISLKCDVDCIRILKVWDQRAKIFLVHGKDINTQPFLKLQDAGWWLQEIFLIANLNKQVLSECASTEQLGKGSKDNPKQRWMMQSRADNYIQSIEIQIITARNKWNKKHSFKVYSCYITLSEAPLTPKQ